MGYDFKIGAPVLVEEGEIGRLRYVVIDPDESVVDELVVEQGRLLARSIVVPAGWVKHADERGIVLNARLTDLEHLPTFRRIEFEEPDPAKREIQDTFAGYGPDSVLVRLTPYGPIAPPARPWLRREVRLGVRDDEVLIGRGARVTAEDGAGVGTVDHLLVDPQTDRVTHVVVHPRFRFGEDDDVIVPIDRVAALVENGVHLRLTKDELAHLPRHRPAASDEQIERQVARTLETQPETRGQPLRAEAARGLVRLRGEVPERVAAAASTLARRIRGVVGVEDSTTRPA